MSSFPLLLLILAISPFSHISICHSSPQIESSTSSAVQTFRGSQQVPNRVDANLSLKNLTDEAGVTPNFPIECFGPGPSVLEVANPEDCEFVINEIVLRLPNPMQEQTWGFNSSADIDLSVPDNRRWWHGQCVVAITSADATEQDTFRPVDVALLAQRIVQRCVVGSKLALGGTTRIGSILKTFFVMTGGLQPLPPASSNKPLMLPPTLVQKRSAGSSSPSWNELDKRFDSPIDGLNSSNLGLRLSCVKPGTPAAAKSLNTDSCIAAARTMLVNPQILDQQLFTTESTGGIKVPFVEEANNCYFMVNTHAHYSSSDTFSLLKVVYFASEIISRCPLGGVAKLSGSSGFFVSVTAVDPNPIQNLLLPLQNSTTLAIPLDVD